MTHPPETPDLSGDELAQLRLRVADLERQLAASNQELTECRRAQEPQQDQIDLLELVVEKLSDGVVVSDRQGRFLVFNPAAERMVGTGAANISPADWSQH